MEISLTPQDALKDLFVGLQRSQDQSPNDFRPTWGGSQGPGDSAAAVAAAVAAALAQRAEEGLLQAERAVANARRWLSLQPNNIWSA
jgi:hypothetical protein